MYDDRIAKYAGLCRLELAGLVSDGEPLQLARRTFGEQPGPDL